MIRLPPVFLALTYQVIACVAVWAILHMMKLGIAPLPFSLLCGAVATGLSYVGRLAKWWLPIQFLFIPGLIAAAYLNIPPAYYLAAFVLMLVVYWSTFKTQVPLYLSSKKIWHVLEDLLPEGQQFDFIDIGSGLGGVLSHLSGKRPDGRFYGVESAPLPFIVSWLRIKLRSRKNCHLHWSSFWTVDLGKYDIVYAYLSPIPMEALWEKARHEMKPGALLISNTFSIPDVKPHRTIQADDMHRSVLYIWEF